MLEVRVARPNEFDAVLAFYTTMIDEMQGTDFDVQWQHGVHPSPTFLRESLEAGQVIVGLLPAEGVEVVSEGSESEPIIASAMVVNHEGANGYDAVPWAVDAAPEQVGVLHVVATLPVFHGRGFGRQLVKGAADIARAQGLVVLRLDTFPHNVRGRGLYESCGFSDRGEWPVHYPALGDIQVAMYELAL
ncbi:GNAT family N-acetyltransferase [Adlercreutzia equolifaciens]|uniref:GNAT family N-acetyltransferase n=1 Tax=Adlercreutzia equolifaciens TaxID=446660 RepID=UPI002670BAC3|nr:GNAT family N-acetyltransferase [Adlercreutzia equolifaciens]